MRAYTPRMAHDGCLRPTVISVLASCSRALSASSSLALRIVSPSASAIRILSAYITSTIFPPPPQPTRTQPGTRGPPSSARAHLLEILRLDRRPVVGRGLHPARQALVHQPAGTHRLQHGGALVRGAAHIHHWVGPRTRYTSVGVWEPHLHADRQDLVLP
jgi:hypothetical protein